MPVEPTGHTGPVRIALLALAALLAFPAAAGAETLRGETSQKRLVSMVVDDEGAVERIRISYSAPCSEPGYRFPNVLRIEPPFDEAAPDRVTERIVIRERLRGGARSRQTVSVDARRTVDAGGDESWRGTFRTRVVLTKRGKHVDTCRLRRVTWAVD